METRAEIKSKFEARKGINDQQHLEMLQSPGRTYLPGVFELSEEVPLTVVQDRVREIVTSINLLIVNDDQGRSWSLPLGQHICDPRAGLRAAIMFDDMDEYSAMYSSQDNSVEVKRIKP